ncbi:uncharacterized protein CC84DRAFT_415703 [Paraphaeosphaeria sporulosa]|uniref:Uncharacterized protein n=1 Tax=Paraphaeosphaeria sporulosa TaxID=1460663 RepID=A0A177BV96_9PLEO|nr:uncharacterized protein CC84DRAFT_415703 [Paraphaeosphaeria sporulosa]OAF99075.1 hypothetical protein CC84DRAFT_415703 [Paraphaeosphaeria sporulosa]
MLDVPYATLQATQTSASMQRNAFCREAVALTHCRGTVTRYFDTCPPPSRSTSRMQFHQPTHEAKKQLSHELSGSRTCVRSSQLVRRTPHPRSNFVLIEHHTPPFPSTSHANPPSHKHQTESYPALAQRTSATVSTRCTCTRAHTLDMPTQPSTQPAHERLRGLPLAFPVILVRPHISSSPLRAQSATPPTYRFGTRSGSPRWHGRCRHRGPRGACLGRRVLLGDVEGHGLGDVYLRLVLVAQAGEWDVVLGAGGAR